MLFNGQVSHMISKTEQNSEDGWQPSPCTISPHITRMDIFIQLNKFLVIKVPGNIGGKEVSVCVSCDLLMIYAGCSPASDPVTAGKHFFSSTR